MAESASPIIPTTTANRQGLMTEAGGVTASNTTTNNSTLVPSLTTALTSTIDKLPDIQRRGSGVFGAVKLDQRRQTDFLVSTTALSIVANQQRQSQAQLLSASSLVAQKQSKIAASQKVVSRSLRSIEGPPRKRSLLRERYVCRSRTHVDPTPSSRRCGP